MCISPLTSLMMDQRSKFTPEFVVEAQTDHATERSVLRGEVQLVFITPERLLSTKYKENLVPLVVDEAHCVKTWGDEFRRAFSKIGDLRSILPASINVMALTATPTVETFDIVSQLLYLPIVT